MATFRLDQESWIPVVDSTGVAGMINLIEAFSGASSIASVGGSPVEAAAITRFLLAIVHLTNTPTSLDAWANLWRDRTKLMEQCVKYVRAQGDAWDLLHHNHPLGQLPDLDKTRNPAHILLYDAARKNNAVLVDHSIEGSPRSISGPELARGLLTANAYAGSSGGGYRSGPLAMRSVGILCGRTLDETLLLNVFVQREPSAGFNWNKYGHPWDEVTDTVDLARRYLWTSRRVRLVRHGDDISVTWMMLAPGDEMPESERTEDPMVVMREGAKGAAYVPLRLETGHALWRSAHVLLNWHEDVRRLISVDQLHRLVRRGVISRDQPVSMRVCAVAGDAQGPSTQLWRDDKLPFGISVLGDENRFAQLARAIRDAEEAAKAARNRMYAFAARYLQNGAESSPDKKDVGRLTDELSGDLVDFWSALAPAGERIACDGFDEVRWSDLLHEAAQSAFRRAVDRLPADARRHRAEFARRTEKGKKGKKGVTA